MRTSKAYPSGKLVSCDSTHAPALYALACASTITFINKSSSQLVLLLLCLYDHMVHLPRQYSSLIFDNILQMQLAELCTAYLVCIELL